MDDPPCPSSSGVSPLARRRRRGAKSGIQPSYERVKLFLFGAVLGFAWGSLLWVITGRSTGAAGWAYFAITCAMIGGGIGGIWAATQARRRGERVTPKIRLPFRRRP